MLSESSSTPRPYLNSHARGLAWLLTQQSPCGAWAIPMPNHNSIPSVAFTSLCVVALGSQQTNERQSAVAWVLSNQGEDGGFGEGPDGQLFRPYATALAIRALHKTDPWRYQKNIQNAVDSLIAMQAVAGVHRGGIGAGMLELFPEGVVYRRPFAHPATTAYAAEALRDAGLSLEHRFWRRCAAFFRGWHNLDLISRKNPEIYATLTDHGFRLSGDGGLFFVRISGEAWDEFSGARDDRTRTVASTGGATCQGLIGYLCAGLPTSSLEVQNARAWLLANYSATEHSGYAAAVARDQRRLTPAEPPNALENPGQTGVYQYFRFMAKALSLLEERADPIGTFNPKGTGHDWADDIAEQLVKRQRPDGAWTNPNPRWLEDEAPLATVFAVLTWNLLLHRQQRVMLATKTP